MKKILFLLCIPTCLLLIAQKANAQTGFNYAYALQQTGNALEINGSCTDNNDNTYITGYFLGSANFNPAGSATLTTAGTNADAFVAKYDAKGNYIWAFHLTGPSHALGLKITTDAQGNLYLYSTNYGASGTMDMDPGTGTSNVTLNAPYTNIISKYDGNLQPTDPAFCKWSITEGNGSNASLNFYNMAVDKNNYLYITGEFNGSADFDPTAGTTTMTAPTGTYSMYVVKVDASKTPAASGFFQWAKGNLWSISSGTTYSGRVGGRSIGVDAAGNVYVSGSFEAFSNPCGVTTKVDLSGGVSPSTGSFSNARLNPCLAIDAEWNAYVMKYNSSGVFQWAINPADNADEMGTGMAVDAQGNTYLTGYYGATTDGTSLGSPNNNNTTYFDPSSTTSNAVTSTGNGGAYIVKYNTSGSFQWVKTIPVSTNYAIQPERLCLDEVGNIYIGGMVTQANVNFDPLGAGTPISTYGSNDIFIAKYTSSGGYVSAYHMGGSAADYLTDLSVNRAGDVITSGYFASNSANFNPFGSTLLSHTSSNSGFVSSLSQTNTDYYKWGGSSTSAYSTAGNWVNGAVPGAANIAVIPTGSANNPVQVASASSLTALQVQSGSSINLATGDLTVSDQVYNVAGTLTIPSGRKLMATSGLYNNGTINGSGTVAGDILNVANGAIAPGSATAAGTLTETGNFNNYSGNLNVKVAGAGAAGAATGYDQLAVSGTATLGGTLNISTINSYAYSGSQAILTAGTITGTFATVNWPTGITNGTVTYNAGSVVIGVPSPSTITSTGTLNAMNTSSGTASAAQTFTVSGTILTANITVTAPTGFEVSADGTTYGATATLTQTGGAITNATVYVRLAATDAANSYTGNVALTTTGATEVDVATVSSTVTDIPIRYVTATGAGTMTGRSWANASNNLQAMIDNSLATDQVWVAAGTYKPAAYPTGSTGGATNRDFAFSLKADVKVYGGFAGTESTLTARNWNTNVTTLSGDIGTVGDYTDDTYHVVIAVGSVGAAALDGFTVSYGNANGSTSNLILNSQTVYVSGGGGINLISSSPTLANLIFLRNSAGTYGGGAYLFSSSPAISNVVFDTNSVGAYGGAVYMSNSSSAIKNSVFVNNTGGAGGAVENDGNGSNSFVNCVFAKNNASDDGGAIHQVTGTTSFTNCTFYGNYITATAADGGAIMNNGTTTITNSIFYSNALNGASGTVSAVGSDITNIAGPFGSTGTLTITYSLTQTAQTGTGDFNGLDPKFLSPTSLSGADGIWGTADDGLQLQSTSFAKDKGTATGAPAIDIVGTTRPQGAGIDMGAYEAQAGPDVTATGILTAFAACVNSASTSQSFTVAGTLLGTNALTVTAPAGFELSSTANGTYSSTPINITPSSGTVATTTLYVRMAAASSSPTAANITIASTGATSQILAVSGTVNAPPAITLGAVTVVKPTATTFSLPYTATTGSPDKYSITVGTNALPNFVAVNNATLGTSPIVVTIPTTAAGTYDFNLTVTNSTTGCVSAVVPFTVTSGIITFTALGAKAFTDIDITPTASSTVSGTPITFVSSNTSLATIVNGKIHLVTGPLAPATSATVTITASQGGGVAGTGTLPADVSVTLTITKPLITFQALGTKAFTTVDYTPTATSSITLTPIIYTSSAPSVATIVNGAIHYVGAGFTYITASQGGGSTGTSTLPADVLQVLTVNSVPTIVATGTLTTLSTTTGTVSATTSFTASGTNLAGNITVTAPSGFELSTDNNTFSGTVSLTPISGTVASTTIYVRLAAADAINSYNGNITLASTSATSINKATANSSVIGVPAITTSGTITALNTITGTASPATSFTVSAAYLTTNLSIVAPAGFEISTSLSSGYSSSITLTPISGTVYSYTVYVRLAASDAINTYSGNIVLSSTGASTINVVTIASSVIPNAPTINTSGTLATLSATYGAASSASNFSISGANMTAGILVTPPSGFEVSTDNVTFSGTVTVDGAGAISATPVYIRLAKTTGAGQYSGNVTLSSTGAINVTMATVASTVSPASLTITANNQSKIYGAANPVFTLAYAGFVNNDSQTSLTTLPTVSTGAITTSPVNTYAITPGGAVSGNYNITYATGTLTITPAPLAINANNQTKVYGSANPALTVSYTGFVGSDNATSLTTAPAIVTTATAVSPVGTYAITASGAAGNNYTFSYTVGVLTVTKATLTITANNQSRNYGQANPALAVSYSGFVNGDGVLSLTTAPTVATNAITASQPGQYPIIASGAVSGNYTFIYSAGTLTIIPLTNATLKGLSLSSGSLSPSFSSSTYAYTSAVSYPVNQITLTPSFDPTANITVNGIASGNGSTSPVIYLVPGDNYITLVVTAQDGVTKLTYTLDVHGPLPPAAIVPTNVLTPNGDGKNDTWIIKDIQLYPDNTVTIYDRAGRQIYSKKGYNNDWNGTLNNAPLAQGTYYYVIDLGAGYHTLKGFITILKAQ